MAKRSQPRLEFIILSEAATQLGFDSEKSVRRLIKARKLDAEKRVVSGKRRWAVSWVNLERYRLIEGDWLKRQVGSVPTLDGIKGQNLGHVHVYRAWDKETPVGAIEKERASWRE